MYLIAKQRDGHRAIQIKDGYRWDLRKLLVGQQEVRIILRVRGRQYLLYHTRDLVAKYPQLKMPQLTLLCNEIISATSAQITNQQQYIEFERVCKAAECRHQRRWRDAGLIPPVPLEQYHGHPIDPKTEQLVSYVRVDLENIIVMDCEPPVDDCEQEELPY